MRILQHTPRYLVLQHNAYLLWLTGAGVSAASIWMGIQASFLVMPVILVPAGLAVVAFTPSLTCRFDLDQGQVTLVKKGVLGSKTLQYPVADIVDVILSESLYISPDAVRSPTTSLYLQLRSGRRLSLGHALSLEVFRKAQQTIREFLSLQPVY